MLSADKIRLQIAFVRQQINSINKFQRLLKAPKNYPKLYSRDLCIANPHGINDKPGEIHLSLPLQIESPASNLSTVPLTNAPEQRAQRKRRAVVLYECDCGDQVDLSTDDVIQCTHKGCKTIWVSNSLFECKSCI